MLLTLVKHTMHNYLGMQHERLTQSMSDAPNAGSADNVHCHCIQTSDSDRALKFDYMLALHRTSVVTLAETMYMRQVLTT